VHIISIIGARAPAGKPEKRKQANPAAVDNRLIICLNIEEQNEESVVIAEKILGQRTVTVFRASIIAAMLLVSVFSGVMAADESSEINAEALLFMDIPVSVAAMTTRKESNAPAVLTVITREEIQNSGARGLNDILSMVPGFTPGKEMEGVIGYGVIGLWSLDGKMLVMVDGIQMNELLYGNPVFGASCFVDYIDRIEIIRGPGSALYGGFGELAVVNIVTRNADTPGTSVSAMYGQMAGAFGHRSLNLTSAGETGGVKVSVNAAVGDGHSSGRDFTDAAGQSFSMADYGESSAWYADIGLKYKDFLLKVIANSYVLHFVDQGAFNNTTNLYNTGVGFAPEVKFTNYTFDSQYKFRLSDKLFITPRVTYSDADAWRMDNETPSLFWNYYVYIPTRQVKLNATAEYDFNSKTSLALGGEYTADSAYAKGKNDLFSDGSNEMDVNTQSLFGEFTAATDIVNVTAGARYDKESQYGGALAPRIALTRALGDLNLKLLYSRAYRAPTILDMDYNRNIKPEFTNTAQAQASYVISNNKSATVDLFDTRIEDVIVYDATGGTYNNYNKTGTQGFNLGYKMSESWGYLNLSYSYYKAINNEVPTYTAVNPDGSVNNNLLLGFPADKASFSASYNICKNISFVNYKTSNG